MRCIERSGCRLTLHSSGRLPSVAPSDPLYGHHSPESERWVKKIEAAAADVLLVGHSHVPFIRTVGNAVVLNPGNIGQPRNSDIRASYAVWEDGQFSFRTYSYPVLETVRKVRTLSFPAEVEEDLISILQSGRV